MSLKQGRYGGGGPGIESSVVGMSITYLNPDTLYDMVCVLCISILSAIGGHLVEDIGAAVKGQRVLNLSGAFMLGIAGVYRLYVRRQEFEKEETYEYSN